MQSNYIANTPQASCSGLLIPTEGAEGRSLGRLSTALDVANAALYLASDEAAFISGVCIEVDGARCA